MPRAGQKHTEEYKKRASELAILKGVGKWMSGRTPSLQHRKRLSEALKKHKRTKEHAMAVANSRRKNGTYTYTEEMHEKKRQTACRGERHPRWLGGKTDTTNRIRHSFEFVRWRRLVYKRDSYTCQKCGVVGTGRNLNAHHIKHFSVLVDEAIKKYPQLPAFDACIKYKPLWYNSNGLTVCIECHKLLHKNRPPRKKKGD